ncbi:MAG: hypothetical protein V9F01_18255 [Chitinophagaceae bacterium]
MKNNSLLLSMVLLLLFQSNSVISQTWQLSGNTGTNQIVDFVGTTDNQQLNFRTNNAIRMTIGTNLGPINPGAVTIGNLDPDATPNYGGLLRLRSPNNETAIDLIRASNNTTGQWDNQIRFYNTNTLRHVIADDFGTGKLVIQTNVDPASGSIDILDIRGRVQIGGGAIPTPAGYKLYVETGILTEKVKIALKTGSDWADFVFNKDYKLMSLQELEQYIQENKHLPGIPTTTEVLKEGVDLGKMTSKLLEKIEELTLYIIQLNNDKQKLEKDIQSLQAKSQPDLQSLQQQINSMKEELQRLKSK